MNGARNLGDAEEKRRRPGTGQQLLKRRTAKASQKTALDHNYTRQKLLAQSAATAKGPAIKQTVSKDRTNASCAKRSKTKG